MTVFDVFLNDRKLCRAGVGADGVLNAIVSWVKLVGQAAEHASEHGAPLEEMRLHVGGLRGGTHRSWSNAGLAHGDRILIAIADANRWDKPAERKRRELRRHRHPKSRQETTRFLNVDLDLYDTDPLDDLVDSFGRRVLTLHTGGARGRYRAHLELSRTAKSADQTIREFVRLIKGLPPRARRRWNLATTREFNVGVQSEARPYAESFPLEAGTIQAAASVNARIGFTVYGAKEPGRHSELRTEN
jgi:hypothetical protein